MTASTTTRQLSTWTSEFGRDYTDRNTFSTEEMDREFEAQFGVRKTTIYRELLGPDRLAGGRALEVGCNIGMQLRLLERANPSLELHGIEPQEYALERARSLSPNVHFHQGTAFELPFEDRSFDVVFTHGVLIHIHPNDLGRALSEIHRVARRLVLVHEYYAPELTEIPYHGQAGLLWKTDFAREYTRRFADLTPLEVRYYPYAEAYGGPALVDQVALLAKEQG